MCFCVYLLVLVLFLLVYFCDWPFAQLQQMSMLMATPFHLLVQYNDGLLILQKGHMYKNNSELMATLSHY